MAQAQRPHRRSTGGKVLPFRAPPTRSGRTASAYRAPPARTGRGFAVALLTLPLATFAAVFLWGGAPPGLAAVPTGRDREAAQFAECSGAVRINCVVDGDTFWYQGRKIRLADINAPELSDPRCPAEVSLARRATVRLTALLNAGPFTLEAIDRSEDQYGRALKVVSRDGQSLGGKLVGEGLAEKWKGYRGSWC